MESSIVDLPVNKDRASLPSRPELDSQAVAAAAAVAATAMSVALPAHLAVALSLCCLPIPHWHEILACNTRTWQCLRLAQPGAPFLCPTTSLPLEAHQLLHLDSHALPP